MQSLLISHGDDAPSGANLEYDQVFTDLVVVAQPTEERQAGKEILAAEEPDHKAVVEKATVVLQRSHDLRAAVYMALSELRLHGLAGFAPVTGFIRGCLEQYWNSCHPQLDADDDNDPTMRINAVLALADPATMLRALRITPLTESQSFGRMTLRDIMVADREIPLPPDMSKAPDPAAVSAAFRDTKPEKLAAILANARAALADVVAINEVFNVQTPGSGPALDPLIKMLRRITARLAAEAGEPEEVPVAATSPVDDPAPLAAAAAAAPPAVSGAITSRRDVEKALERVIEYYAANEPSSPLPILLRRAKRLVGADFLEILKDIAPKGIENVRLVGGLEEEKPEKSK